MVRKTRDGVMFREMALMRRWVNEQFRLLTGITTYHGSKRGAHASLPEYILYLIMVYTLSISLLKQRETSSEFEKG